MPSAYRVAMERRSKRGGELIKGDGPRRRNLAPQCARGRKTFQTITCCRRERGRSARPRTGRGAGTTKATSEVLRVISASPGELEASFSKPCWKGPFALRGQVREYLPWDANALHILASHNTPPASRNTVGVYRFALIRCPKVLRPNGR